MGLKSSLRSNKLFFEEMFYANWKDTPIHFAGQEFKADGLPQWINPVYTPTRGKLSGLSSSMSRSKGILGVVCWAATDADVMDLGDHVIEFVMVNANNRTYSLTSYEITDHAWHDSGSVYLYLTFDIDIYEGSCLTDVTKYVVNNSIQIVNGQYMTINP